jgi:acyl-CoA thioester hydrolase
MADNDARGKRAEKMSAPLAGAIGDDGTHRLSALVYYADTDFSGAVYHARYLEFFERGRSDFLRCADVRHSEMMKAAGGETLFWAVRHMDISFEKAGAIDDVITIETAIAEIGGARIVMDQTILRGGEALAAARVTAVIINGDGRPRRVPQAWRTRFARYVTGKS